MTEEKRFEFDLNRLTYDEFLSLYDDVDPETPELAKMAEEDAKKMLATVLVRWPSEMEITPDNIGKLGILDFKEMQEEFSALMKRTFDDSKN